MQYGKLVDNELVLTESTKMIELDGSFVRVNKTVAELEGYKLISYNEFIQPNIYELSVTEYIENTDRITVNYTVVNKPSAEIVAINEEFWSREYFQILSLMPEVLYAPYTSYLNGEVHNLLKDDYAILLLGASANQLPNLELYSKPDMTQMFTSEYISSLKVIIDDPVKMANTLGFFGTLNYGLRTVPSVL